MKLFGTKGEVLETWSGDAYCVKCKEKREMKDGHVKTSDSGRRMAFGICPICGTKLNRILGKTPEYFFTPQPEPTIEDITGKPATWVIAAQIGDPNLMQINAMAERVLKMLLEVDSDIENKIELWEDRRAEKKLYKKWRKKIGNEIANEIAQLNLDVMVANTPLLLEALVNVKKEAIHIAKGKE